MVSEVQKKANEKYIDNTYSKIMLNLHTETDAKIIKSIEVATLNGKSKRQWLREVWNLSH